jgi:Uma2 family endonuclease
MNLSAAYIPRYTVEDYEQWEGRWELIRGIPHAMSPQPSIRHQIVSSRIAAQLERELASCAQCTPLLPVDWQVDDETILQPDNLVVCGPVGGKRLLRPPVLVFEILSPSTAQKDRIAKFEICQAQGVRYFVLVDPDREHVEVFEMIEDAYRKAFEGMVGTFEFDLGPCRIDIRFDGIWQQ